MNVLDIYPNLSWSFHCENEATLALLRAAASEPDPDERERALDQITTGEAYCFVGDPVCLDLADGFFDEIRVNFTPSTIRLVELRQRVRHWVKPNGMVHLPELADPAPRELPYVPLAQRLFGLRFRGLATAQG